MAPTCRFIRSRKGRTSFGWQSSTRWKWLYSTHVPKRSKLRCPCLQTSSRYFLPHLASFSSVNMQSLAESLTLSSSPHTKASTLDTKLTTFHPSWSKLLFGPCLLSTLPPVLSSPLSISACQIDIYEACCKSHLEMLQRSCALRYLLYAASQEEDEELPLSHSDSAIRQTWAQFTQEMFTQEMNTSLSSLDPSNAQGKKWREWISAERLALAEKLLQVSNDICQWKMNPCWIKHDR